MNDPVEETSSQSSAAAQAMPKKVQFTHGFKALSLSPVHTKVGTFFRARLNMDVGLKFGSAGQGSIRYITMSQANGLGAMSEPTHFGIHRLVAGSDKFSFAKGLVEFRTNQEGLISGPRFGIYKDNFPTLGGIKPVFLTLAVGKRSSNALSPDNGNVIGNVILLAKNFDQLRNFQVEFLNDVTIPFRKGKTPGSQPNRRIDEHLEFTFLSPKIISTSHCDVKLFYSQQQDFGVPKGSTSLMGLRLQLK